MSTAHGPTDLPPGLREQVLGRSLGLRPAGRATPEAAPISEVEAFRRAATALGVLLDSLTQAQWRQPALRGSDVQGLIGHLVGVEEHVQRALAGDPDLARADHVASTQPSVDRQHGVPVTVTRTAFGAAVARTIDLLAEADVEGRIELYGARLTIGELCVARTFELWTHENDIRQALHLAATEPDASTLALMTRLATDLLPRATAARGLTELTGPIALRLVLTGPGGGTWQLALGAPGSTGTAALGIVADAVGFCRLVANRTAPADLDTYVTGDPRLAEAVLRAATTLALD